MEIFQLTVIKQSRALLVVLIFSLSIIGAIFLSMPIDNIILKIFVPILAFALINFLSIYYAFAILNVQAVDKKLKFKWNERKLIFNFTDIDDINLKDINTLVIDHDLADNKEILQSITTNTKKIKIGVSKYWRKDADEFIIFLKKNTNARIIDSWDTWKEKGFLKISYYITLTILLTGAILTTWIVLDKGISNVDSHKLILFIGSYLTLIPYYLIMKRKMGKKGW